MPGEIRSYGATEHAGNALNVAPAQNGPGWVVLDRGCDTLSVASNPLPGASNEAFATTWRGVDRHIAVSPEVDGPTPGGLFVYHANEIYVLTTGSVWSSVHTTTGQTGGATSPYHSGLYYVLGRSGDEAYVCGLYKAGAGSLGWVKMRVRDGTWSSGTVSGLGNPDFQAFAHGIQFRGELAMPCGDGRCAFFNPETEEIRTEVYEISPAADDWKDKLWLAHGRLFIVQKRTGGVLHVRDRVTGSIWLDVATLARDDSGAGDFDIWPFFDGATIFVPHYTTDGGTGWRLWRIDLNATPGAAATVAERTDPVIPNAAPEGDYRYPTGAAANASQRFNPRLDFTRDKRGALGGVGGTYNDVYVENYATNAVRQQLFWSGEATPLAVQSDNPCSAGSATGFGSDHTPSFAIHSSRWALGDRSVFPNEPTVEIVEATPYTDGVVSRGLLLRLNVHKGSGSPYVMDLQLLYELQTDIGNRSGPPIDFLPQAQGTRVAGDEGGVATLNLTPGDQGNSLDGVVGKINAGILVQHGAVALGPFEEGTLVSSSGTGTGTIRGVRGGTVNRVVIEVGSGAFLNGETITQTTGANAGANAVISADPESDWYHYALIDLDAIGAAEFEWLAICGVTVDPIVGRPVPIGGFTWTGALSMVQVPRFAADVPDLATSPVHAPTTFQDAPPTVATSPVHAVTAISEGSPDLATSPVHAVAAFADQAPTLATSPVHAALAETQNLPPGMVRPNTPQPTVEGGGDVGFQFDAVEAGVREELNLQEPTAPPLPGLDLDADPALPAGPQILLTIDGVVELGRAVIDAANEIMGTEYELLDMAAAGFSSVSVLGFLWVCDAGDYDTVTTPGQVSIGGNDPMFTNMRPLADHPIFPDPLGEARAFEEAPATMNTQLGPADVLGALLGAQATATEARFTLIAYGRVNS